MASEPSTSDGGSSVFAPASPTFTSALGCRNASARAVAAAASTGPSPQASVAAPSAPSSSRSVAATTRITARTLVPRKGEPAQGTLRDGISTLSRSKKPPRLAAGQTANNRTKAVRRRGGLSFDRRKRTAAAPRSLVPPVPLVGDLRFPLQDLRPSRVYMEQPHPEVRRCTPHRSKRGS